MAHNRIGQATTEPFVSCDCVTIVDIVSFVRTSQKLPDDGLPNFFVNVDLIVNFAKLNSLQTIFLRDREIKNSRNVLRKFSRNLSHAKIKENKVVSLSVSHVADDYYYGCSVCEHSVLTPVSIQANKIF